MTTAGQYCKPRVRGRRLRPLLPFAMMGLFGLNPAARAEAPDTDDATLATVTVSAHRRDESALEVPVALDVVRHDELSARLIDSLSDLSLAVPSLQVADNTSIQTVYIRGVGGGGRNVGFDTRAGVYLDGVYIGTPPAADALLFDLARVEVLRGPQGYLYGQNTVSGAINLITRAPGERFESAVRMGLGSDDELRSAAMLNLPIDASVRLKLAASARRHDGTIDNVTRDEKVGDLDDRALRAQLRLLPDARTTLDFSADYAVQESDKVGGEARSGPFGALTPPSPAGMQAFVTDDNRTERDLYRNGGVAATIEHRSGERRFTSITAYRDSYRLWHADVDHSALDLLGLNYHDDYETFSQELRVASADPMRRGRYVAGLFVSMMDASNQRRLLGGTDGFLIGLDPAQAQTVDSLAEVVTQSYALFGAYDYALTPLWTLNTGARLTLSRKALDISQSSQGQAGINFAIAELDGYHDTREETALTPMLGLTRHLGDQTMLYIRYARGAKSGGFNADFITVPALATGIEFDEETADSFELGFKALGFDQRLSAALALFLSDYQDYQVSQFVPVPGSDPPSIQPTLTNAGKVRSYGAELTLSALPQTKLRIDLDLAWLHAQYRSFEDGGGPGVDYDGNRTEYAPRLSAGLSIDYGTPLAWPSGSEWFVRPSWSYRSEQYSAASNAPLFRVGSRSLIDARIGLRSQHNRWEIALYGRNLADETYELGNALDALTTVYGGYGPQRSYGVELQWRWF